MSEQSYAMFDWSCPEVSVLGNKVFALTLMDSFHGIQY